MLDLIKGYANLLHHPSWLAGGEGESYWILYIFLGIAILISLAIHEFGHAWMADKLGDPGPREAGRLTLAPWAHLDPLGTLIAAASCLIGFPVGWGRPVKTDPEMYRVDRKLGIVMVAMAGPLASLAAALALALPVRFLIALLSEHAGEMEMWLLFTLAVTYIISLLVMLVSLSLFAFNLLPLYPLDGSPVLANLLPKDLGIVYVRVMKRYGLYIFLGLLGSGLLNEFVGPVVTGLARFLLGV